jgi:hypothetical protein
MERESDRKCCETYQERIRNQMRDEIEAECRYDERHKVCNELIDSLRQAMVRSPTIQRAVELVEHKRDETAA